MNTPLDEKTGIVAAPQISQQMLDFIEMEVRNNEDELNYINQTYSAQKQSAEEEQAKKE